jgi:hypothetical protein
LYNLNVRKAYCIMFLCSGFAYVDDEQWHMLLDVGKTPPSRFQQREGSLRATPGSRSEHTDKCVERDGAFHAKHAEIKDKPLFSVSSREKRGSRGTAESGNNRALRGFSLQQGSEMGERMMA